MEIGARIRELRKQRGLNLEELSAKSGVALATLSRIETGKTGGNFKTHQKIASAFGSSIAELYQGLEEPVPEAVWMEPGSEEAESFTYDEKTSAILLAKQVSGKNMLPQMLVFKPGGKTTLEQYREGTERWVLCLEGTLEITVGDKSYRVSPGSTLYFKASVPHQFRNTSEVGTKALSVMSPAVL